jgi:hypothetical protein
MKSNKETTRDASGFQTDGALYKPVPQRVMAKDSPQAVASLTLRVRNRES